jgi:predicted nuclease of predicted toxin-antitoxin system
MDEDSSGDALTAVLRSTGLDVVTAYEVGLERTDDAVLLEWAARESRVVVTANKLDFLRLSLEWAEAGRSHAGIVIRYPNQAPEVLAARAIAEELLDRDDCTDLVLWANAR